MIRTIAKPLNSDARAVRIIARHGASRLSYIAAAPSAANNWQWLCSADVRDSARLSQFQQVILADFVEKFLPNESLHFVAYRDWRCECDDWNCNLTIPDPVFTSRSGSGRIVQSALCRNPIRHSAGVIARTRIVTVHQLAADHNTGRKATQ